MNHGQDLLPVDIDRIFEEGTPIDQAILRARRDVLLDHQRTGDSLVVWEDGQVVRIPADQFVIGDLAGQDES